MRRTLLFLLLAATLAPQAPAKVVYVNLNSPGPAHDGTSWATAFGTVQAAVNAAMDSDELWVGKGAYFSTSAEPITLTKQLALYGGFAGTETARGQRDSKANVTALDGAGQAHNYIVACRAGGIVVDGFTIRNVIGNGVLATGTATIRNNTFLGCSDAVDTYSDITVSGSTFSRNGLAVLVHNGTATIHNNTLSDNGTGVSVYSAAILTNNTVSGNGVGAYVNGSASLINNIVAFNGVGVSAVPDYAITAFSHNLVFGSTLEDYRGYTAPAGQGNLTLDPKLSNSYRAVHIQPDSPCIDAGDDAAVVGTADIDGQTRIQGAHVDIGSDESDGTTWNVPTIIWHVSPSGDDANDGLTWATAKKTVVGAVAEAQGADEIWVAKGTYVGGFDLRSGEGLYGGFAGTETQRSQRNWTANVTILDGTLPDAGAAVSCSGPGVVVDGFTVRNCGNAVDVSGGVARLTNDTISGNRTALFNEGDVILQNCVVMGNPDNGIVVFWGSARLSNNTICGNGSGIWVYRATAEASNNIIAYNGTGILLSEGEGGSISTFSHNDVFGNTSADYAGYASSDFDTISADPLFANRATGDLHLLAGSPCIDTGDDTVVKSGETDIDGRSRVIGAHVDMGAYEYGTTVSLYSLSDVIGILRFTAGIVDANSDAMRRLNPEVPADRLDLRDAVRIARKVAGLEANP